MKRLPISLGQRFGRLVVMREGGRNKYSQLVYLCRCDCGAERTATATQLYRGIIKSCGCQRRIAQKIAVTKHGYSSSPTYSSWNSMIQRCSNPSLKTWANYGGRGITVCERWMKFENFLADMGERPEGLSIDRIDNNGNYEPGNCRWSTASEQCRNTRRSVLLTLGTKTQCLMAWANETGMSRQAIWYRLQHGWSVEAALTTPLIPHL